MRDSKATNVFIKIVMYNFQSELSYMSCVIIGISAIHYADQH